MLLFPLLKFYQLPELYMDHFEKPWLRYVSLLIQQPSQLKGKNVLTASLHRGKTPPNKECPGYETKPSDGEASALELWGMWSTPLLPLLLVPLWPGVRVSSIYQIELVPWYDSKPFNGEAPVLELREYPFIVITSWSTLI